MTAQSTAHTTTIMNRIGDALFGVWSAIRLLARNRVGLIGLIGLTAFLLLAFVGPYIVPLDTKVKVKEIYAPISAAHPLGTDSQGKDVWSQIVHGGRELILVALSAALLSTVIGASLGSIPVWYAGVGTLAQAQSRCSPAYSFTGGIVTLTQYASGGFDADWRC